MNDGRGTTSPAAPVPAYVGAPAPAVMHCPSCRYSLLALREPRCPECGRAFDPADPRTFSTVSDSAHAWLVWIRRVRVAMIVLFVPGWWYFSTSLRTYDAGPGGLRFLGVLSLFGLPYAALLWAGVPWRRYAVGVLLTVLVPVLAADAVATLEERLFLAANRGLPPNAPLVFEDRWWPNGDSYLYYDPATGTIGGGD